MTFTLKNQNFFCQGDIQCPIRPELQKGMATQPLEKFLAIKGLGDVKIIRIAAAFEIARRIVNQVLKEKEE